MTKKNTLLQNLMAKLVNMPHDKIELDPYYYAEGETIRAEVDSLLGFHTTNEQFDSLVLAWHFKDVLIARCGQYKFKKLRKKIDAFIKKIEVNLENQQTIMAEVNFLAPVLNCNNVRNIISLSKLQLENLKKIRGALYQRRGSRGDEDYLTKCACFELFFIGELLGLPAVTKSGEKNDLITFAEIMTRQTKSNRSSLSENHQKYNHFKEGKPEVNALILKGKRRYANNPEFSSSLESFQTNIYSYIPIPSSK